MVHVIKVTGLYIMDSSEIESVKQQCMSEVVFITPLPRNGAPSILHRILGLGSTDSTALERCIIRNHIHRAVCISWTEFNSGFAKQIR